MERITSHQVLGLMEAYAAVHAPQINEDNLWESYLTEEFISEAYQTVADYLVHNGFVPGYNTAEVYMSEMAVEDIDSILFETGVLDEQYLIEADFFKNLANTAIGGAKRASSAVAGGVRNVASGADRAVGGAVRAGQTAVGAVKRAGTAVTGAAKGAVQTVAGGAQRAAGAVQRAVTPVAQAVKGTAQRAVSAGQSALGGAARAVQGAGQAVAGGAQRAVNAVGSAANSATRAVGGAVNAAGRKVQQEVEISRKVGAGEPLNKPSGQSTGQFGRYGAPSSQVKTPTPAPATRPAAPAPATRPAAPAPATRPAAPAPGARPATPAPSTTAKPTPSATPAAATGNPPLRPPALPPITGKPSLRSGIDDIKKMQADSRQRQGLTQSFDPFDVVLGHLLDEGYADTKEAALQIMANMSEEWKNSIIG